MTFSSLSSSEPITMPDTVASSRTAPVTPEAAAHALLAAQGLDLGGLFGCVSQAMGAHADFADLFVQASVSEHWALEKSAVKRGVYHAETGFGLRAVHGEQAVLSTSQRVDAEALRRAAGIVSGATAQGGAPARVIAVANRAEPTRYYPADDPLGTLDSAAKIALLERVDRHARACDPSVAEVEASLSATHQLVVIARSDGRHAVDVRPLVRLDINVQVLRGGARESASRTLGGRAGYAMFTDPAIRAAAREAVEAALGKLDARAAPAGVMSVVIGPGWNGVLLHEAVGHGLEGDFNRRGASAFAGRIGERVAAPGVTIVDDGTVPGSRGSVSVDDEGTPGRCTTLIEDGILRAYIHDETNARLMGTTSTGNGRRESYQSLPMPRMTNTYMRAGERDPEEIVRSVKRGIYVAHLGGGSVDITSGRFVFSASEAFLIEDGRLGAPIRGATVLGNGPESLKQVRLIGNDLALDTAMGVCGKAGQSVPVGVGQPTLRIDEMTVGGTA